MSSSSSTTRVRLSSMINVALSEKTDITLVCNSVSGKQMKCFLRCYETPTDSYIYESQGIVQSPATFNISSYPTTNYVWASFGYEDDSTITPSDISNASISYEIDIVWRMGTNCPTQDAFPVIPDAITSPSPNSIFLIKDGVLYQKGFPELPDKTLKKPYPHSAWRIQRGYNDWYPFHELLPNVPLLGAFANAVNLKTVRIPETVKTIGRYAFRNTQLTSVTIARDCVYYPTSFPDGCIINFY